LTFCMLACAEFLKTSDEMRCARRGMAITCKKYCSTVASMVLSPG
jgi:hypothetical protein